MRIEEENRINNKSLIPILGIRDILIMYNRSENRKESDRHGDDAQSNPVWIGIRIFSTV